MKNATFRWTLCAVAATVTTAALGGLTQASAGNRDRAPPAHYSGLLDDSTPYLPSTIKGSPYEMHGHWSLQIREGGKRRHVLGSHEHGGPRTSGSCWASRQPTIQRAEAHHTHHISMSDGVITSDWQTRCPTFSPVVENGFVITGTATLVTGNGGPRALRKPIVADDLRAGRTKAAAKGGPYVEYSNITLTFGTPASNHFGTYPIHGVIVRCDEPWEFGERECTVQE